MGETTEPATIEREARGGILRIPILLLVFLLACGGRAPADPDAAGGAGAPDSDVSDAGPAPSDPDVSREPPPDSSAPGDSDRTEDPVEPAPDTAPIGDGDGGSSPEGSCEDPLFLPPEGGTVAGTSWTPLGPVPGAVDGSCGAIGREVVFAWEPADSGRWQLLPGWLEDGGLPANQGGLAVQVYEGGPGPCLPEAERLCAPIGAGTPATVEVETGEPLLVVVDSMEEWLQGPISLDVRLERGAWTTASPGPLLSATRRTSVWTGDAWLLWGGLSGTPVGEGAIWRPDLDRWDSISAAGAPSPRQDHASAWTGQALLVFGGRDEAGSLGDGGRYDPAEDAWTPLGAAGAPSPRHRAAAVWTGDRFLVWGGRDEAGALGDGAAYDPETGSWSPIETAGAPAPRSWPYAVWTGAELLVWGGLDGDEIVPGGGRYDPAHDDWAPLDMEGAPPPSVRGGAVWTGSEVVVWGGVGEGTSLAEGGAFDPYADSVGSSWRAVTADGAPTARFDHATVWTGTHVLVWGGEEEAPGGSTGAAWDPALDAWSPIAPPGPELLPPLALEPQLSTWTGSQLLVLGHAFGTGDVGLRHDPAAGTWTPLSTFRAPAPRRDHTAVWTGTSVALWGGAVPGGAKRGDGGRYLPAEDLWLPIAGDGAPAARGYHAGVWTGEEMIVWGGQGADGQLRDDGGAWSEANDTWRALSTDGAPAARWFATAVWTGEVLVVWGGATGAGPTGTGSRYDPQEDAWTPVSQEGGPSPRTAATAVWSGAEVLVWGGQGPLAENLGDGGRYDPAADSWTPIATAGAPKARYDHAAVWTGSALLVWGGYDTGFGPVLWDGGLYDPATDAWTPVAGPGPARGRRGHQAAWTGSLFVAWGGEHALNDVPPSGEVFDPETGSWWAIPLLGGPTQGRKGHRAVWTGTSFVVHGGAGAGGLAVDTHLYVP